MATSTPTLDDVFRIVRQLSVADQARLVARVTPHIAVALAVRAEAEPKEQQDDVIAQLPAESRAAKLARDPNSALAKVLALTPDGFIPPTDEDIARWREERLMERYGA